MVSDWLAGPGQSINYMTCHDNLVLWDKLKLSMPGATDDLLKRTAKIGYLVLLTSQGVPFMQGGEEFGRTKGGDDNSYASPDSVNEVDWSLKEKNHDLFTYVRDLIALRKAHPLFRLRTREEIRARLHFLPTDSGLAYEIDGNGVPGEDWNQALVIVNPDDENPMSMPLPGGNWEAACDERGATMGRTMNGSSRSRQSPVSFFSGSNLGDESAHLGGRGAVERFLGECAARGNIEPANLRFNRRDRRQAHAQRIHAESQEQRDSPRVAGNAAANPGPFAVGMSAGNAQRDEAQHGRVQRIDLRGELRMASIHRERVLGQVVGADREKVRLPGKLLGHERRRRDLHHDADRRQRHTEPGRFFRQDRLRVTQFAQHRNHRQHDADLSERRST